MIARATRRCGCGCARPLARVEFVTLISLRRGAIGVVSAERDSPVKPKQAPVRPSTHLDRGGALLLCRFAQQGDEPSLSLGGAPH
jgi:hypothetical protein